jgi:hypothetical protein
LNEPEDEAMRRAVAAMSAEERAFCEEFGITPQELVAFEAICRARPTGGAGENPANPATGDPDADDEFTE